MHDVIDYQLFRISYIENDLKKYSNSYLSLKELSSKYYYLESDYPGIEKLYLENLESYIDKTLVENLIINFLEIYKKYHDSSLKGKIYEELIISLFQSQDVNILDNSKTNKPFLHINVEKNFYLDNSNLDTKNFKSSLTDDSDVLLIPKYSNQYCYDLILLKKHK